MGRTITISEELYSRLESEARELGLDSIEHLLEEWERKQTGSEQRREQVKRIDLLRERLSARYGQMPDSTVIVREDRGR